MPKSYPFVAVGDIHCAEVASLLLGAIKHYWGAKHVSSLAHGAKSSNGRLIVDCAFLAHPGGLVMPDEIVRIRLPLALAIGDSNSTMSMMP